MAPYKLIRVTLGEAGLGVSLEAYGEARNANSMDEVADSAWFTNRPRGAINANDNAPGACNARATTPS